VKLGQQQHQYRLPLQCTVGGLCRLVHRHLTQATAGKGMQGAGELHLWRVRQANAQVPPLNRDTTLEQLGVQEGEVMEASWVPRAEATPPRPMAAPAPRTPPGAGPVGKWKRTKGTHQPELAAVLSEADSFYLIHWREEQQRQRLGQEEEQGERSTDQMGTDGAAGDSNVDEGEAGDEVARPTLPEAKAAGAAGVAGAAAAAAAGTTGAAGAADTSCTTGATSAAGAADAAVAVSAAGAAGTTGPASAAGAVGTADAAGAAQEQ
jgi:hypothetical protein